MADKKRLSSTVVVSQSFRREARERNRSPKHSESHHDRRNSRESKKHDDKRHHSPPKRSTDRGETDNYHESKQRRDWQNERIVVKDRISFRRYLPKEQMQINIEVNTDPRDVPRGKRYFEHDDREGSNNQNFNSIIINNRRSFPQQRSRSPLWKHDHFEEERRQNRLERPRQTWQQRDRNTRSSNWRHDKFQEMESQGNEERPWQTRRQRDRNTRSPIWSHDKFQEMESQESEQKDEDKDTPKKKRKSS